MKQSIFTSKKKRSTEPFLSFLSIRNLVFFSVEFVKMLAGAGQEEKEQKAAAQNAQKGGATGSTPAATKSDTKTDTKHDPKHGTPTRKK